MAKSDPWSALGKGPLAAHHEFLVRHARPSIDLIPTPAGKSRSRIGGSPDLPNKTKWPEDRRGPCRFLVQFDCAEIPRSGIMPEDGLLSLFQFYDEEDGDSLWCDNSHIIGLYMPPGAALRRCAPPKAVVAGAGVGITFQPTWDVPGEHWPTPWPLENSLSDAYHAFRQSLHPGDHHLLGYTYHYSLGYDPAPPGWLCLLNLNSDDDLGWGWQDMDRMSVLIDPVHLAKLDFSHLKCDAG